jgi:hypothetical protein
VNGLKRTALERPHQQTLQVCTTDWARHFNHATHAQRADNGQHVGAQVIDAALTVKIVENTQLTFT